MKLRALILLLAGILLVTVSHGNDQKPAELPYGITPDALALYQYYYRTNDRFYKEYNKQIEDCKKDATKWKDHYQAVVGTFYYETESIVEMINHLNKALIDSNSVEDLEKALSDPWMKTTKFAQLITPWAEALDLTPTLCANGTVLHKNQEDCIDSKMVDSLSLMVSNEQIIISRTTTDNNPKILDVMGNGKASYQDFTTNVAIPLDTWMNWIHSKTDVTPQIISELKPTTNVSMFLGSTLTEEVFLMTKSCSANQSIFCGDQARLYFPILKKKNRH